MSAIIEGFIRDFRLYRNGFFSEQQSSDDSDIPVDSDRFFGEMAEYGITGIDFMIGTRHLAR
ncbi:MAG: hypothetical protein HQM09_24675 [Candidatus Riflebacteria bacterium]|nr:hypothetical protein [Candidatus Riflebacteria bacterium]